MSTSEILQPEQRARLLRLATYASVAVALGLILLKGTVWTLSGSVSLLASLIDSLMDAAASLINLFAVRFALKPADRGHRFGHGKAEALAGLAQATFISVSAVLVFTQGVRRLLDPQPLDDAWLGVLVMIISILATIGLLLVQRHVIRRTQSTAISADALHYRSDLLLNGSIILALVLAQYGLVRADALFGVLIALYIGYSAIRIGMSATQTLMDHELPDPVRARVLEVARAVPGVLGVHDLRTRQSGQHWFMQVHVELAGDQSLSDAHAQGEAVRLAILGEFPQAEVLVHKDPVTLSASPNA